VVRPLRSLLKGGARRLFRVVSGEPATSEFRPIHMATAALLKEIRIARVRRDSRRQFTSLAHRKGLKLHLGSGLDVRPGWVNVDLALYNGNIPATIDEDTVFINHDLRSGLPLHSESCELIYASHFLEHLEYADAQRLLRDCLRVLQPAGVLRIAAPDFAGCFSAYLKRDFDYFDLVKTSPADFGVEPGTETLVDWVHHGVYQCGEHRWIADEEKFELLLRHIGFASATRDVCREGLDPSSPLRRRYSFYIDARK
jgi:predicted SAM-dependent methyltransferase